MARSVCRRGAVPHTRLPQGGYSDVTTRGEPERLLPAQFALDRDEFVRRFAERELLYFQREEPQSAPKPDRVIALDLGVRTWGTVRLALAAAALVLMKKDAKRTGAVRLTTTAAPHLVDVLTADVNALVRLLEASDLSEHPGPCLARALQEFERNGPRDLILLTHARALRKAPIMELIRSRSEEDRLFSLAVDERGGAELFEWTDGGPTSIRRFRVDLAAAEAVSKEAGPAIRPVGALWEEWQGDIEPIGFPFRPGLVAEPTVLGFDADGEWLVAASQAGWLQALAKDAAEVLPRPCHDGNLLKDVDAILGVSGGVVICGRIYAPDNVDTASSLASPQFEWQLAAAHYDRRTHHVKLHYLGKANGCSNRPAKWMAFPQLNCIAVKHEFEREAACTVDLTSGERYPYAPKGHRAAQAWNQAAQASGSPPFELSIVTGAATGENPRIPWLKFSGNSIAFRPAGGSWTEPFEPQRDGKPLFAGASIHRALYAGGTVALALTRSCQSLLVVIEESGNRILGEATLASAHAATTLSADGRSIAFTRYYRTLVAAPVNDLGSPWAMAKPTGLHSDVVAKVNAAPFGLFIRIGKYQHAFTIKDGELNHQLTVEEAKPPNERRKGIVAHAPTAYDTARFPPREIAHAYGYRAVVDRLGQVLLFREDDSLAASFLVRRERFAAWSPGGVFWGDPMLIGGPPTENAAARFVAALVLPLGVMP